MPGQPVFHGYPTSASPAGLGGSARVETSAMSAGNPSDMRFFVWLAIIGVLVPILLIGGLQIGGFSFVFRKG